MLTSAVKFGAVGLIAGLIVGFTSGYSYRSDKALIDELESAHFALKTENNQLVAQLEKEHEQQQKSKEITAQTKEDLADLEKRYDDAIAELNALQLQYAIYTDSDTATLPEDATASKSVPQSQCRCSLSDKRKLQRLLDEQMMIARDCDINATYLNNLIDWYQKISQE